MTEACYYDARDFRRYYLGLEVQNSQGGGPIEFTPRLEMTSLATPVTFRRRPTAIVNKYELIH